MPRSRADIEAELNVAQIKVGNLTAELASTQPYALVVNGDRRAIRFVHIQDKRLNVDVGSLCNDVSLKDAAALRDWLNYHFPKENA